MAAVSQDVTEEELLQALARSVVINGYHAGRQEGLEPTEYLKLLTRYLSQARGTGEAGRTGEDAACGKLRLCPDRRTAASPWISDARRMRQRPGFRDRQRDARLPDD